MRRAGICGLFFILVLVPLAAAVELPRAYIDTTFPTQTGATTVVPTTVNAVTNGQAFQAALNAAQPGDTIVLQAGATYQGNFVLPIKPGMLNSSWIIIQSSALASLPPQGTRVQASDRQFMPELISPNSAGVISTATGSPAAGGYWFAGIFFSENSSFTVPVSGGSWPANSQVRYSYGLVSLGTSGATQDTLAEVPSRFTFDRTYFYGAPNSSIRRALALQSAWTAVVDSRIEGMKERGSDSQAIWGSNGPGPYKIVNNHLEGAGENVMFGGADPSIPNLIPADIEFRKNYFYKPPSWQNYWSVKNLFELKFGHRVLVEGNVMENSWVDGQVGFAVVLKSTNQGNTAPWSETRDVTMRYNIIKNSASGIAVAEHPEVYPVIPMTNVYIGNNLLLDIGNGTYPGKTLFQIGVGPSNLTIENNTGFAITHGIVLSGSPRDNLVVTDNVIGTVVPQYGTWNFVLSSADGNGYGTNALNAHWRSWTFTHNTMPPGVQAAVFPPGNFYTAPNGAGGVDRTTLATMTAGAVSGVWGPCTVSTWTPNAAVLCGTVAQTSNCGTSRTVSGSVTCTASQACTNNVCVSSSPVVGDRNSDGRVDAVDLAIVAAALGTVSAGNDLNGDGTVNVFDLVLLTRNWS